MITTSTLTTTGPGRKGKAGMTRRELAMNVQSMREAAGALVRKVAAERYPHVAPVDVEALCQALGEISIDEALAGLSAIEQALIRNRQ